MKITCFEDTDTALLEFGGGTPTETRELSEDIYLGLDESGHVVSITVEHASIRCDLSEFSFKRINKADEVVEPTRLRARLTTAVGLRSPPRRAKITCCGVSTTSAISPSCDMPSSILARMVSGLRSVPACRVAFPRGRPARLRSATSVRPLRATSVRSGRMVSRFLRSDLRHFWSPYEQTSSGVRPRVGPST